MAYSPRLKTKSDLKAFILRNLGSPVIEIEITPDQLDDQIDNTLELYFQRCYAGVAERYLPLDVILNQQTYLLPYEIFAVVECHSMELGGIANNAPSSLFSLNQFVAADLYRGSGKIDLLTYELVNQMLATLDLEFSRKITYDFNVITKELYVFEPPNVNQVVLLRCYVKIAPIEDQFGNEVTNIYNELIIRKLATEYSRRQWAHNLMKYGGSVLPNGLMLNANDILQEANTNIQQLEIDLHEQYELPIDFFCG
jgi:hypothetical protein